MRRSVRCILRPQGVNLPNGVATTADAYRYFLKEAGLSDRITETLAGLDVSNVHELVARHDHPRYDRLQP